MFKSTAFYKDGFISKHSVQHKQPIVFHFHVQNIQGISEKLVVINYLQKFKQSDSYLFLVHGIHVCICETLDD